MKIVLPLVSPNCTKCELSTSRTQVVNPEVLENTPAKIRVMAIGEAPGSEEDKTGRPFVGKSGKILREELVKLPGTVVISNIVKCRPPNNRDPRVKEKKACTPYLLAELETFDPHLILLFGRHATYFFIDKKKYPSLTEIVGRVFKKKYVPMLHPASLLYNPKYKIQWEESWKNVHQLINVLLDQLKEPQY